MTTLWRSLACPLCQRIRLISHNVGYLAPFASRRHASSKSPENHAGQVDMSQFPVENIRNFSIIAHVDHGKSTLADRLLEITGTISQEASNKQVLDKLQVERERGITVKAQTASMIHQYQGKTYLLNLIDTPGHVDFNYEVSRSLAACQGVLLLVDANQGVQAQTVANFYLAFEAELAIIPVINKIDLKQADVESTEEQMRRLFDFKDKDLFKISAKLGINCEEILDAVIQRIPPPKSDPSKPWKALLFDSTYNHFRGAVTNVAVIDGKVQQGDKISSAHNSKVYEVQEVGIMSPDYQSTQELHAGQVGYLIAGMKSIQEARIGDTLHLSSSPVEPLPGFKPAKPMVFGGIFPMEQSEYRDLKVAVDRLTLNDSSVTVAKDSSPALGLGFRLGFLGLLHMEVFNQRLEQEYNATAIVTTPSVPCKARLSSEKLIKQYKTDEITIFSPAEFPEKRDVTEYLEPIVMGTIITPDVHLNKIFSLCEAKRGEQVDFTYIDASRVLLKYKLPLNEIVVDFYDLLKSITSGYASFDYEDHSYEPSDLVKLDVLLNGQVINELSTIVHKDKAYPVGKTLASKLKDVIPRQLYEVVIQAALGNKVIARETIKAYKKNVLAKCYGGDISRKMKLLKRQAEGKKRMKKIGNVDIPKDAFISVLKR
ncbi:translation factor Guf1, mitochondrial-like [Branchiostoma floridae x Branchiostoma japonicum]